MLSFFFLEYVKTMEQERQRKYAEAEKSDNKIVGYNDTLLDEVRYISRGARTYEDTRTGPDHVLRPFSEHVRTLDLVLTIF